MYHRDLKSRLISKDSDSISRVSIIDVGSWLGSIFCCCCLHCRRRRRPQSHYHYAVFTQVHDNKLGIVFGRADLGGAGRTGSIHQRAPDVFSIFLSFLLFSPIFVRESWFTSRSHSVQWQPRPIPSVQILYSVSIVKRCISPHWIPYQR